MQHPPAKFLQLRGEENTVPVRSPVSDGTFFKPRRRGDGLENRVFLESQVLKSGRAFLEERGFVEMVVPRVVRASGACENMLTLFEVTGNGDPNWFDGKRAYLAQTGQLYLEALVPFIPRVWCAGPSFRAEPDVDNRHLAAFHMIEIEFAGRFNELLDTIEGFLARILSDTLTLPKAATELLEITEEQRQRLERITLPYPRITYDDAIVKLQELGEAIAWGDDISSKREAMLVAAYGDKPLFLTRFPDPDWNHGKEIEVEKFFNMIPDSENPGRVLSCDVILPHGGEAVGAAERLSDSEVLKQRLQHSRMFKLLQQRGGSIDDFSWYIEQMEKHGSVPHAGCGFGMARILKWLRGADDVRDVVAFPTNRATLI